MWGPARTTCTAWRWVTWTTTATWTWSPPAPAARITRSSSGKTTAHLSVVCGQGTTWARPTIPSGRWPLVTWTPTAGWTSWPAPVQQRITRSSPGRTTVHPSTAHGFSAMSEPQMLGRGLLPSGIGTATVTRTSPRRVVLALAAHAKSWSGRTTAHRSIAYGAAARLALAPTGSLP